MVKDLLAFQKFLNGGGLFLPPFFEILEIFLIQNKKLLGVPFLLEVDWLSGLGVRHFF